MKLKAIKTEEGVEAGKLYTLVSEDTNGFHLESVQNPVDPGAFVFMEDLDFDTKPVDGRDKLLRGYIECMEGHWYDEAKSILDKLTYDLTMYQPPTKYVALPVLGSDNKVIPSACYVIDKNGIVCVDYRARTAEGYFEEFTPAMRRAYNLLQMEKYGIKLQDRNEIVHDNQSDFYVKRILESVPPAMVENCRGESDLITALRVACELAGIEV